MLSKFEKIQDYFARGLGICKFGIKMALVFDKKDSKLHKENIDFAKKL